MLRSTRLLRPALISRVGLRPFSIARPAFNEEDEGKKGFIKSVLYGKEENGGVTLPGDNTTHSKKLARGKYVHEMQSKFIIYNGIQIVTTKYLYIFLFST